MNIFSRLWSCLKSQTFMAIVAFFSIALAVYQGFFYERRGDITISTDAFSRVFDIHQPVGNLEISYSGKDLRTAKKTLWSISFTIKNTGNAEIKKGDFDDQVPFGIQFSGAEVVETPIIKTSVDYLAKNLKIETKANTILVKPAIFEAGDEVQISALLLGSDSEKPSISPIGKIAGIKRIELFDLDKKPSDKSIWSMITEADSVWVHVARFFVYFLTPFIATSITIAIPMFLVVLPFQKITGRINKSKREKSAIKFEKGRELNDMSRNLLELYIKGGDDFLKSVNHYAFKLKLRKDLALAIKDRIDEIQLKQIIRVTLPIFTATEGFKVLADAGLVVGNGPEMSLVDGCERVCKEIADFMEVDLPSEERMQKQEKDLSMYTSPFGEPNTEFFQSKD